MIRKYIETGYVAWVTNNQDQDANDDNIETYHVQIQKGNISHSIYNLEASDHDEARDKWLEAVNNLDIDAELYNRSQRSK